MASTYENDLRLEEMATGENSGSWGTKTNTNLELIADAFSYGTETIADADTTITIADGAADAARSLALKINSSADLTTTRTITLAPNTTSKVWIIENNTSGGQTLTISAGSGSNVTLPNGVTKIIATDGIGAAANVTELYTNLHNITIDGVLSLSDGSNSAPSLTNTGDTNTGLYFPAADKIAITTGGTERVIVDSSGNVGIGTSSPAKQLHIESSTGGTLRLSSSDASVGAGESLGQIDWYSNDASGSGSGVRAFVNVVENDGGLGRAYDMTFGTGQVATATERMRIDSSGNVGIGSSTPGMLLEVDASSGSANDIARFSGRNSGGLTLRNATANEFILHTATSDALIFGTNGNNERMRIDSSGNVGIGTSSPVAKNHLRGSGTSGQVTASWMLENSSSGTAGMDITGAAGASRWRYLYGGGPGTGTNALTEAMCILTEGASAGNVGIGTGSPSHLIDGRLSGTSSGEVISVGNVTTGSFGGIAISDGGTYPVRHWGSSLEFYTGNSTYSSATEAMRIDSSGNVGIGVSNPSSYQTNANDLVVGNLIDAGTGLTIVSGTASLGSIHFADSPTGDDSYRGFIQYGHSSNYMRFATNASERMRIDSSGNVGIGTSSPSSYDGEANNLVVADSGHTGITIASTGTNQRTNLYFADGTFGSNAYIGGFSYDHSNNNLLTRTGGSERMRIDGSGNLLVGTTIAGGAGGLTVNPDGYIQARVSGDVSGYFDRLSNDGDIVQFRKDGSTVGSIGALGSRMSIGTGDVGLFFNDQTDQIQPINTSTNAPRDAAIDLGATDRRFKDAYLSGGIYLGGVGAANKLDDYEEGTFTPTIGFRTSATGSLSYTRNTFRYIKVGSSVFITGFLTWYQNNFTANSGAMQLQGLPFAFANSQEFRGGVNVVYSDANFTGVTIYQQGFRNEQAETSMVFNFSDTTNGAMDSTITSYTSIPSGGSMMITGTYTTT